MRVISKAAISEFSKTHKDALESLLHWHGVTRRATWKHLVDVRADFPHADAVGIFTVFNICGNKYRLASISTGGLACAMAQDGTPTLSQSRVPHDL